MSKNEIRSKKKSPPIIFILAFILSVVLIFWGGIYQQWWPLQVAIFVLILGNASQFWGDAKKDAKDPNKDQLLDCQRIESKNYHSDKIWEDFKFYYQTTLAVLAAIGFLMFKNDGNDLCYGGEISDQNIEIAIIFLSFIELMAGCFFSLFIISHESARIRKFKEPPTIQILRDCLSWVPTWMIIGIFSISSLIWIFVNRRYPDAWNCLLNLIFSK